MARTRDMTTGSPARHILLFCLPIIAGNLFQQLYSLIDTFIIGNIESVTEMTAVSSAGWLDWMVLSIAIGLTQGFSIQIAQSFGAGDYRQLRTAVGQSLIISAVTIVVMEIIAQAVLMPVLRLMQTHESIIHLTCLYLRIIFAGMGLVMGFNLFSGFLRAVGDSTTPLIAMIAAACTNIVLDLVFVAWLKWSVAGVGIATVISQGLSCAICLVAVLKTPVLRIAKEDLRYNRPMCSHLLRLGLPLSFQNAVISLGGLVMQTVVNGFDFMFVAGFSATSRLTGLIELAGSSLGHAVGTFAGQNLGAGRLDRVKLGMRRAAQIGIGMAVTVSVTLILFGRPLLSLFINAEDPAIVSGALKYAYQYMTVMCVGLPMLHLLFGYRSTLQGIGDTVVPMISGFVELAMRVGTVLLLPMLLGVWGVYIAEVMAWFGAGSLLIWGYYRRIRKMEARR